MRKNIISILGGNSQVSDLALELAHALGKAIIDQGWLDSGFHSFSASPPVLSKSKNA